MEKISIIVPIFREKEAIKGFIADLEDSRGKLGVWSECVVVDDYSNDETSDMLKAKDITLLTHRANLGYGAAIKTGIRNAKTDIICITDGDSTYSPHELKDLIRCMDGYDMVVGARVGEAAKNFPFYQKIAKGLVCRALGLLFNRRILDINSGFRVMRKDVVAKYLSILPDGFSFTSSITLAMLLDGRRIKYIPISYSRRRGKSKVRVLSYTLNFVRSFWRVLYNLRLSAGGRQYRGHAV